MKAFISLLLTSLFLTSCGHFADGSSVWQGGLFIVPLLTFLGAVWFGYKAYKAHNSGSWIIGPDGETTNKDGGNVPYTKIGWTWFSAALLVATIVIVIMVNSDK